MTSFACGFDCWDVVTITPFSLSLLVSLGCVCVCVTLTFLSPAGGLVIVMSRLCSSTQRRLVQCWSVVDFDFEQALCVCVCVICVCFNWPCSPLFAGMSIASSSFLCFSIRHAIVYMKVLQLSTIVGIFWFFSLIWNYSWFNSISTWLGFHFSSHIHHVEVVYFVEKFISLTCLIRW